MTKGSPAPVRDLEVIDTVPVAAAALDPVRAKILELLAEPGSATTVAAALGSSRQKVNYHLRTLEQLGLVRLLEERPRRGLTERVMVASARNYVVSPAVLSSAGADPSRINRLSADYLIALGARLVREVGTMARKAGEANRPLATLAVDTDIRFGSPARRAEFAAELAEMVTELAAKYHDEDSTDGRWHRLVVGAHPRPKPNEVDAEPDTETANEADRADRAENS